MEEVSTIRTKDYKKWIIIGNKHRQIRGIESQRVLRTSRLVGWLVA